MTSALETGSPKRQINVPAAQLDPTPKLKNYIPSSFNG